MEEKEGELQRQNVALLLEAWQQSGEERGLEALVAEVRPMIESAVAKALRSRGVRDPSAADDAVSRVMDHLRRLPGVSPTERRVEPFMAGGVGRGGVDAGVSFVVWLARKRARDVARSIHRRSRHVVAFSQLDLSDAAKVAGVERQPPRDAATEDRVAASLASAVAQLDARSRDVIERLLAGQSQTDIARQIGVCEGTVSRIRAHAIGELRGWIADGPADGMIRRPK